MKCHDASGPAWPIVLSILSAVARISERSEIRKYIVNYGVCPRSWKWLLENVNGMDLDPYVGR